MVRFAVSGNDKHQRLRYQPDEIFNIVSPRHYVPSLHFDSLPLPSAVSNWPYYFVESRLQLDLADEELSSTKNGQAHLAALGDHTFDRESSPFRSGRVVCQPPHPFTVQLPEIPSILLNHAVPYSSPVLNRRSRVFLKLDNLQPAGSFKSRGIGNYILRRAAERHGQPIHFYAASGGNAGIACVHAAKSLGYPATVVIPRTAKPAMVRKLRAMGATEVIQYGASIAEAQEHIQTVLLPLDPTGVFVPPFDHPDIWDGNATIMSEIAVQLGGKPDVVVCSIGGGGLINGIMQVLDDNGWSEDVQVLAMETKGADSLNQSLQAGELVTLPRITSQAMSLGVVRVSERTFEYARRPSVTSLVLSDAEAARGCCLLAEHERMMVELTVGVNVPVCYDGLLQRVLGSRKVLDKSSKVVIVVCGGNDISVEMLMDWYRTTLSEEDLQGKTIATVPRPASTKLAA
jgi:L-serine/L-threonine ammonia-lyase